jgi:hypothetical protein
VNDEAKPHAARRHVCVCLIAQFAALLQPFSGSI